MAVKDYDFSGWATKNDLLCSDGRTIRKDAFKHNDGDVVPLVWNHCHNDPFNVLGNALLENRDSGVYAYCSFNDTESGRDAKELVKHGDVVSLSIYANQLKQNGNDVLHGAIKEVSLVLAGANPGAVIEAVLEHGYESDDSAIIWTGEEEIDFAKDEIDETIAHADAEEINKDTDKESKEVATENKETTKDEKEKTVKDVFDTLTEEQKTVVYALIGQALEDAKADNKDEGETEEMKHNVFENENSDDVLMHDELNEIMRDGKRYGSLKESFLAHADSYGIENISYLQPDDTNIYDRPPFINNQPTDWVSKVVSGVHNTPFAKVRMIFADITEDEARAKGYTKGNLKKEEVFKLLKRSVAPTTIYKKQKFDRDDLIDADFDVVPWIRQEMELKLDEERARAYLFGDGRSASSDDKINESCIIPVVNDAELYTIVKTVTPGTDETLEHAIISASILAQDDYQGSGNITGFFKASQVSSMLLMEDKFGHRLYKDIKELASAMGINEIVKVPAGVCPTGFYGVLLDLRDYNVGMKNEGKKTMFDDFDIDYNQQKYLIETRQSGALTRPYSAIVLKAAEAAEAAG